MTIEERGIGLVGKEVPSNESMHVLQCHSVCLRYRQIHLATAIICAEAANKITQICKAKVPGGRKRYSTMLNTFEVIPDLLVLSIEACVLVSLTGDEQRWALEGVKPTSVEIVITWRDGDRHVDSWIGITVGKTLAFRR